MQFCTGHFEGRVGSVDSQTISVLWGKFSISHHSRTSNVLGKVTEVEVYQQQNDWNIKNCGCLQRS